MKAIKSLSKFTTIHITVTSSNQLYFCNIEYIILPNVFILNILSICSIHFNNLFIYIIIVLNDFINNEKHH